MKMVDGRRTRTTDGRRLDGYTTSSPCESNGSGELILNGPGHITKMAANGKNL